MALVLANVQPEQVPSGRILSLAVANAEAEVHQAPVQLMLGTSRPVCDNATARKSHQHKVAHTSSDALAEETLARLCSDATCANCSGQT